MSKQAKTWFITGASRGLGRQIAIAALAAGDNVVATARNASSIELKSGATDANFLAVELDVTQPNSVKAAVQSAVERFGNIDVLVNNAGYGQLGFFEENTIDSARNQFETNVFGVFNVTWAVLPVMRSAMSGRIFNISSSAGLRGSKTGSIYCASKFAVEGFSESLAQEVGEFGIHVTIVEPGLFRTDFLSSQSVRFGAKTVEAYAESSTQMQAIYRGLDGQQKGDPKKLGIAIVQLSTEPNPPIRFAAGKDAVAGVETKVESLRIDLETWRDLSLSTTD